MLSRFLFTTFFCVQIICAADKSKSDRVVILRRARFYSLCTDLKSMTVLKGKNRASEYVCLYNCLAVSPHVSEVCEGRVSFRYSTDTVLAESVGYYTFLGKSRWYPADSSFICFFTVPWQPV